MTEISKEYAVALFMLAAENNILSEYKDQLKRIKDLLQDNPDYIDVLESPAIPLSERIELVDKAFSEGYHEYIVSFIKLLCENRHVKKLCSCINEFIELARSAQNCIVATVYYVEPLTKAQQEKLNAKLEKISGKNVEVVYVEDRSLIGGIKIKLDDKLLDGSLSGRLNKVKGVMSK
jgi:F-type H+-transporting ATPase subunit delta